MNSLDALRLMVDHYKGGREAVALRLGKSDDVLRKELAGAHGFKLGVVTACSIASLCAEQGSEHAEAYATAVASHCGAEVRLQPRTGDAGGDLVQRASVAVKETAEVMSEVAVRYADGRICLNDMRAIEKEAADAIHAIQAVLQSARAAYRASQPQAMQSPEEFVRGLGEAA